MKIMICEQDQIQAKVLTDLLNVYQFKLITVDKNHDFIKQVQIHKPAVIILGHQYSHGTGKSAVQQLRMHPALQHIPVIVITNDESNGTAINPFHGDGLVELMKEPFKIKYLRHCIDRWTTFRSLHIKQ